MSCYRSHRFDLFLISPLDRHRYFNYLTLSSRLVSSIFIPIVAVYFVSPSNESSILPFLYSSMSIIVMWSIAPHLQPRQYQHYCHRCSNNFIPLLVRSLSFIIPYNKRFITTIMMSTVIVLVFGRQYPPALSLARSSFLSRLLPLFSFTAFAFSLQDISRFLFSRDWFHQIYMENFMWQIFIKMLWSNRCIRLYKTIDYTNFSVALIVIIKQYIDKWETIILHRNGIKSTAKTSNKKY